MLEAEANNSFLFDVAIGENNLGDIGLERYRVERHSSVFRRDALFIRRECRDFDISQCVFSARRHQSAEDGEIGELAFVLNQTESRVPPMRFSIANSRRLTFCPAADESNPPNKPLPVFRRREYPN